MSQVAAFLEVARRVHQCMYRAVRRGALGKKLFDLLNDNFYLLV